MNFKKMMIAMLVSVPCFVTAGVIASASSDEVVDQVQMDSDVQAEQAHDTDNTELNEEAVDFEQDMAEPEMTGEPDCTPWQYC